MNRLTFLFFVTALISQPSFAAPETEEEISFDTIVSQLSQNTNSTKIKERPNNMMNNIMIHSGVGFVQSFVTVKSPSQNSLQGFHRGIQASLGIDLFSENWLAEGTIRSFGEESIDSSRIQLREFDLKLIYRSERTDLFGYRMGFGLAARDLTLKENGGEEKFSTPASIALFGIDTNLSNIVSIGGEISYRTALVSDSADRSAVDFALKVDAHF